MKTLNKLLLYGVLAILTAACAPDRQRESNSSALTYTCPMHPQIVQEGPGSCPICGMDLVPVSQTGGNQEIMLSKRQMELANVQTAPLLSGEVGSNTFLTGKLSANQELVQTISSRAPGRLEKLHIKETGQRISKGQPLYEIYSEELLTLQKEYLLVVEQYRELGSQHSRYRSFMDAARKKLLLYGMTEAQIGKLAETGTLSPNVVFTATASGVVREVAATEGQYVAEGSTLYRLEGLGSLWVEAELYPGEAALVERGEQVQVIIAGYENEPVKAEVTFLHPEYRAGTQVIVLRARIANSEGRYAPGMQASVALTSSSRQALALPPDAIIRGEAGAHVWIKSGEGTFIPRMVKTGMETFDKVEITDGLQEGDSVVISGAYLLYSELVLKKGAQPMAGMDM